MFYPVNVLCTLSRFFADVSCVKWNSVASIADQFVGRILFCSGTFSHYTLRIQTGYNVVGAGNTSNSRDRHPWLWRTCIFKLIYHNVFIHKLFNKQILFQKYMLPKYILWNTFFPCISHPTIITWFRYLVSFILVTKASQHSPFVLTFSFWCIPIMVCWTYSIAIVRSWDQILIAWWTFYQWNEPPMISFSLFSYYHWFLIS